MNGAILNRNELISQDLSGSKFVSTLMAKEQHAPGSASQMNSSNINQPHEGSYLAQHLKDEFIQKQLSRQIASQGSKRNLTQDGDVNMFRSYGTHLPK